MRIITGMHRSGTSLIARLFYEAGADMGNPETFYRPDRWNPEGYFEQPDIHAVNMPLINGPWWKFSYFWLPSTKTILKRAGRRAGQIRRTAQAYCGKVIKETRFCLTLPAWLKYGAHVDGLLIVLRDPVQVARSIQKRNHTFLRHGYYMWRVHNERILAHAGADDIPVWFVYYPNILNPDTYLKEIDAAFRFFDFHFSEDELMNLRDRAVRPGMNHNPGQTDRYPDRVQALWDEIKRRHAAQFEGD